MKPTQLFIAGTHTDAGKTLVSTILCAGLKAAYWKPIQTGSDPITGEGSDRKWVADTLANELYTSFPESYSFPLPQSPNIAADRAGASIDIESIKLPNHNGALIVEGAGGLLVPLNDKHLQIEFIRLLGLPVVLVCPLYLGAINHTLLSVEALRNRNIPLKGLILNGEPNLEVENTIARFSQAPVIGRVPILSDFQHSTLISVFNTFVWS